jgi:uncharacterized lipoprotein YbaY
MMMVTGSELVVVVQAQKEEKGLTHSRARVELPPEGSIVMGHLL